MTLGWGWDDWSGPLSCRIDQLVNSFLSKLTQREQVPLESLLIAYITIAQGGLGFMDPFTRAIPDFVITMSHAIHFAEKGVSLTRSDEPIKLPVSLSTLFSTISNPDSKFLNTYHHLLPNIAEVERHHPVRTHLTISCTRARSSTPETASNKLPASADAPPSNPLPAHYSNYGSEAFSNHHRHVP